MFYWWPIVKDCGVPMPKTTMIEYQGSQEALYGYVDGNYDDYFKKYVDEITIVASAIGYPIFVRTDMASSKHDWKNTCYIENEEQIPSHLSKLIEFTFMADIIGLGFLGIAIREFLTLNWKFTAFWGEMPVAKEFRFFVKGGEVQCWHPYWPPRSIEKPSIENWREVLKEINTMFKSDYYILEAYAQKIGRVIEGYWSIDFCETKNNGWYMTDMAVGEESYHWGTCPHAPPEMLEHYGDPEELEEKVDWMAQLTNNSGDKK